MIEHMQPEPTSNDPETLLKNVILLAETVFTATRNTNDKTELALLNQITIPASCILYSYTDILHPDFGYMLREYVLMKLEEDGTDETGWIKEYEEDIAEEIKRAKALYHPVTTPEEKAILDIKSLPVLEKMMHSPDDSPKLFKELANVLHELVKSDQITATAAVEEISHSLDRLQIKYDRKLQRAIKIIETIDLPGKFKTCDPKTEWNKFIKAL